MNEVVKKESLPAAVKSALSSEQALVKMAEFFSGDSAKMTRFKSALIDIASSDNLAQCSVSSVLKSAFSLAELDLDINRNLAQAYIVKYKSDAQAVISYKGWQTLAERAGKRIKAHSVFICDEFSRDLSEFDEKIIFVPNDKERNSSDDGWYMKNLRGVLVLIKDMSDGYTKRVFVPKDKLEKIKTKSPSAKSNYSPWAQWGEEMYQAKAIKYVLSREALNFKSQAIANAIALDNKADMELTQPKITQIDLNAIAYEQGEGQIIDENGEVLSQGESR